MAGHPLPPPVTAARGAIACDTRRLRLWPVSRRRSSSAPRGGGLRVRRKPAPVVPTQSTPTGAAEGRRLLYLAGDGAARRCGRPRRARASPLSPSPRQPRRRRPDPARMVAAEDAASPASAVPAGGDRPRVSRPRARASAGPIFACAACEAITAGEDPGGRPGLRPLPYGAHGLAPRPSRRLGWAPVRAHSAGSRRRCRSSPMRSGRTLPQRGALRGKAPVKPLPYRRPGRRRPPECALRRTRNRRRRHQWMLPAVAPEAGGRTVVLLERASRRAQAQRRKLRRLCGRQGGANLPQIPLAIVARARSGLRSDGSAPAVKFLPPRHLRLAFDEDHMDASRAQPRDVEPTALSLTAPRTRGRRRRRFSVARRPRRRPPRSQPERTATPTRARHHRHRPQRRRHRPRRILEGQEVTGMTTTARPFTCATAAGLHRSRAQERYSTTSLAGACPGGIAEGRSRSASACASRRRRARGDRAPRY